MTDEEIKLLYNSIRSGTEKPAKADAINVDDLYKDAKQTFAKEPIEPAKEIKVIPKKAVVAGVIQGADDVINTVGKGIGYVDRTFFPGGETRAKAFDERVATENKAAEDQGLGFEAGRLGGQVIATAPLTPVRAAQGIRAVAGALPTIAATGEKVAAPLINRLGAAVGTGALGGATYGAATSASNDEGVLSNTATGAITGALAGPVVEGAAAVGSRLVPAIKDLWANVRIGKLASNNNMSPSVAKNIVARLEEAGFTPATAQAELNKMGPKATLADLDRSLTDELGGLASMGGKPTTIAKNRMDIRADTADSSAHKIMEQKLGPKPDLVAEGEKIYQDASNAVRADYRAAHASTDKLDIGQVVKDIDSRLESAVGEKASALATVKGYLFKTVKDAEGNATKELKTSIKDLHEVREGLDNYIDKLESPIGSQGKKTLAAVKEVRNAVDAELKKNPQMASADAKFAERMTVKEGLETGKNAFKGKSFEEFEKDWSAASLETKQAIAKGMRATIGDFMDAATRGELSEAQRLFGKSALNKRKLQLVFGNDADEVINSLKTEGAFRATEKGVLGNSATASRLAVRERYEGTKGGGDTAKDMATGLLFDSVGGGGVGTAIATGKRILGSIPIKFSEGNRLRLSEGTADILSRSKAEGRDTALSVIERVGKIQDGAKFKSKAFLDTGRLPMTLPVALGEDTHSRTNRYINSR